MRRALVLAALVATACSRGRPEPTRDDAGARTRPVLTADGTLEALARGGAPERVRGAWSLSRADGAELAVIATSTLGASTSSSAWPRAWLRAEAPAPGTTRVFGRLGPLVTWQEHETLTGVDGVRLTLTTRALTAVETGTVAWSLAVPISARGLRVAIDRRILELSSTCPLGQVGGAATAARVAFEGSTGPWQLVLDQPAHVRVACRSVGGAREAVVSIAVSPPWRWRAGESALASVRILPAARLDAPGTPAADHLLASTYARA
ncbi:hypothetical protein L6R52_41715, partial [Myxococcota bacterium]|nr:hypothetical protein [Myxococcota bacterium]